MPGVRAICAVGETVWVGGKEYIAVVTKMRGGGLVLGATHAIAAAWGLNENKGYLWNEARRLLAGVSEDLERWAEQSRARSGNPKLAEGPQMAHSGQVRHALKVLLWTLGTAEGWHSRRGLDGSRIEMQPVQHLTTMVNEGFFGEASVGLGAGGMSVTDYAREYRRINGNIRMRGQAKVGYSDPAFNRSYSKRLDLAGGLFVETNRKNALKINVKKADVLLVGVEDERRSDECLRTVARDMMAVARQSRVRQCTRERVGSQPLFVHYRGHVEGRGMEDEDGDMADVESRGNTDVESTGNRSEAEIGSSKIASTRTEEVGQPGTESTAWGAGDVVAAETSAENGYMWLGVLQDNLGPLVKDDTCISIQWLETDDVPHTNSPNDIEYTE
jgi:hypothetical protein